MSDTIESGDLPSGRFVLRIEPELHAALKQAAEKAGLSLNEVCARKLAAPGLALAGPAGSAVERSVEVAGGRVTGILVFGSWARGELSDDSDVDLLIVVPDDLALSRALYHRWDESPVFWEGHRVEPHFAHHPGPEDPVTGLWAEAAMDGVVLFDPSLCLARRLVRIRSRILAGELVRKETNGHTYWVEAA